jgi:hypothetical protein
MKVEINKTMLSTLKRKAKAQYYLCKSWDKLSKVEKLKTYPPSPAIYGSDFILSYKSNGIILHKGYLLLNLKTKTKINI